MLLAVAWVLSLPAPSRAVDVASSDTVVCGGVLGLRGWADWHNGWGNHASACLAGQRCVRGVLEVSLDFRPRTTGFISADTDEHLLAQGIHAGVSLGPQTAKVSFWRDVIRKGRIVAQRVSCRDRAFRNPLANVWLVWIVQP
jgi:hypothetical protein